MSRIDGILAEIREYGGLSMDEQAELIQRLRDGEGDNHKPAGQWVVTAANGALYSAEEAPVHIDWVHGPNIPVDAGLTITFYHGQMDGKPVIQIDGTADFRINVNDAPIWDQSTDEDYESPDELRRRLEFNRRNEAPAQRRKVWVGVIKDYDGTWIYVGATEQALLADMRSNYGRVEYREESTREWIKRADDAGATVTYDSYYLEED